MAENPIADIKDINPRITAVHFDIKNSDAILELERRFSSLNIALKENAKVICSENNFIERYNVSRRCESNHGDMHIIDVQPDFRYPTAFIIYSVVKSFPELDTRAHPSVSIYSLAAYQIVVLTAHLLLQDTITRPVKSLPAQSYFNDSEKRDFIRLLQGLYVPESLATLLEQLATTYDPARPECVLVPSLAECIFEHDYGRLIPPMIFLRMHNLLTELRAAVPVSEMIREFYSTQLISIDNVATTISHVIGGIFNANNAENDPQNWINRLIISFFAPACGRLHQNRPQLCPVQLNVQAIEGLDFNPYDYMLGYDELTYTQHSQFLARVSSFMATSDNIKATPLGAIAQKIGGITVMTHTIENMELPTWHRLNGPSTTAYDSKTKLNQLKPVEYAKIIKFKQTLAPFTNKTDLDKAPLTKRESRLLTSIQHVKGKDPVKRRIYKEGPPTDVFIFQPYLRETNIATIAMTLGIKIEQDEIDACIIPTPNATQSLFFNNSNYFTGSIPIGCIRPVIPNGINVIDPINRVHHDRQINGFAIRDGSRNVVPFFAQDEVAIENNEVPPVGLTFEDNHTDPTKCYTYTAFKDGDAPSISPKTIYVWSSYRASLTPNLITDSISFYYSMRPMYGAGVPLHRCPHPSIGLP